jgi:putative membrane protein
MTLLLTVALDLTELAQATILTAHAAMLTARAAMLTVQQATQSSGSTLPPFTWTAWSGDGVLRGGLLLLAGAYLLGIGPLRKRFRLGPPPGWKQIASYLSGVFFLFIALEGPVHELSDHYLFSAHMVQHMLLIYAAPPLMLLGTPAWLLRPLLKLPGVLPVGRALTNPFVALLTFNVVFSVYHIPLYYNAIVADHRLHVAAHIVFIALAVHTWWPLLSPLPELPRLSYPLRMLYVFAQTLPGFLVGSFITNSRTILYPFYSEAPRVWGLSPQDDQQLGGLIMWVVGGFYLLLIYSAIFFAWARAEGVHDDVAQPLRPRPRPVTVNPQRNGASSHRATPTSTSTAPTETIEPTEPHRVAGSPRDLGARHVVTSAPDRSRLN